VLTTLSGEKGTRITKQVYKSKLINNLEKANWRGSFGVGISSVPAAIKNFSCPLILTFTPGMHVVAVALPPLPMEGDTALKYSMYFGKNHSPQDEGTKH